MGTWVTCVPQGTRTRWWPEVRAGTAQGLLCPGRQGQLALTPRAKEWHRLASDHIPTAGPVKGFSSQ